MSKEMLNQLRNGILVNTRHYQNNLKHVTENMKKIDKNDEIVKDFISDLSNILPSINISYNEMEVSEMDENKQAKWSGEIGSGVDGSKLKWFMSLESGVYIEAGAIKVGVKEAEALYKIVNWCENTWRKKISEMIRNGEV